MFMRIYLTVVVEFDTLYQHQLDDGKNDFTRVLKACKNFVLLSMTFDITVIGTHTTGGYPSFGASLSPLDEVLVHLITAFSILPGFTMVQLITK